MVVIELLGEVAIIFNVIQLSQKSQVRLLKSGKFCSQKLQIRKIRRFFSCAFCVESNK